MGSGKCSLICLLSLLICLQLSFAGCTSSESSVPDNGAATPSGATITATATMPATATETATTHAPVRWQADGAISAGEYPDFLEAAGGKFSVFWKTDSENLYMALKGEVQGWVAVGFDPSDDMKDADIILGGMQDGDLLIYDMYSTGKYGPHPPDADLGGSYDILESGGSEAGGVTVIEFSRKLDTGDRYDNALQNGDEVVAIWSMANSDDPDLKHNVGKGSLNLMLSMGAAS